MGRILSHAINYHKSCAAVAAVVEVEVEAAAAAAVVKVRRLDGK